VTDQIQLLLLCSNVCYDCAFHCLSQGEKIIVVPFDWIGSSSIDVPNEVLAGKKKGETQFDEKGIGMQSKHQTLHKPKGGKRK